ncbi:ribosomal protein S18-alanine N-acetyltransferase [Dolosicoccus paucivorans]|uniref:ribosomal protein S18-alanine N-acetyltransferase n=1 Tax=Dolosicoccus paucivorans TaxID=84521 RepID=UPI000B84FEDF|nr:ribosomal protein S18-alanine N-acetyltransferase [Dolosicoccus paucivorans]
MAERIESMKTLQLNVVPFKGTEIPDVFQEEMIRINEQTFNWSKKQTTSDFEQDHSEYYLLLHQMTLLGFVSLHTVLDEASINQVYIDSEFRQQGLGSELVSFVLDQLAARGFKHLFLEVRSKNTAARQLYNKLNFQELTIRPNYYQNPADDAVIMQRILTKGGDQSWEMF